MKENVTRPPLTPRAKEFEILFKKSGWDRSKTARDLEVTESCISAILLGKRVPSKRLLTLLRMKVEQQSTSDDSEVLPLIESLRKFDPVVRRQIVRVFLAVVDLVPL